MSEVGIPEIPEFLAFYSLFFQNVVQTKEILLFLVFETRKMSRMQGFSGFSGQKISDFNFILVFKLGWLSLVMLGCLDLVFYLVFYKDL